MVPGAPCTDAPVRSGGRHGWLLRPGGARFTLLHFGNGAETDAARRRCATGSMPGGPGADRDGGAGAARAAPDRGVAVVEEDGLVSQRFDARPGTTYLLRPDQHVCARWRSFDPARVRAALARATAMPEERPCSTSSPTSPAPTTSTRR